jgi:antitoxin CcdA
MRMTKGFKDPAKPFRREAEFRVEHIGQRKPARKRAANVSVDEDILAAAKKMKINLSQALEDELRKRVQAERERQFQKEHKEAFESYNRFIEKNGVWGAKYRKW